MGTTFILLACLTVLVWSLVQQCKADKQFITPNSPERVEAKIGTALGALGVFLTIIGILVT